MSINVLITDDDTEERNCMYTVLENQDYTISHTENGTRGIQQVIDWTPGIILQNFPMPDMQGYKAGWIIRNTGVIQSIPIIAMASNTMAIQQETLLASGITDYHEKPVPPVPCVDQISIHVRDKRLL